MLQPLMFLIKAPKKVDEQTNLDIEPLQSRPLEVTAVTSALLRYKNMFFMLQNVSKL